MNIETNDSDNTDLPKLPLWKRIVGLTLCAIVLVAAAWFILRKPSTSPAAMGPMMGAGGPVPVNVETILPANIPLVAEYLGQTVAFQHVEVRARVAAFLEKKLFDEGTMVKEGQVLFRLERDTFEADLEAAEAVLAQTQASCEQAERTATRLENLFKEGAAGERELDEARRDYKMAQADVLAAKARVRQAKLSLDYTVILSPLTGMIGKAGMDVGSYLGSPSDGPLAVVQQVDPLYVEFPITERDLLVWRELAGEGNTKDIIVELTLPDGKPYKHQGKVGFMDVSVAPSTGTALIRATIANPDNLLKPGQLLRVKVTGMERKNTLTVPQQAVIQSAMGAMVYRVDDKNTAQMTPISLGQWYGDRWIVTGGLASGSRVVVDHLSWLRPGTPVVPTEQPPPTAPAISAGEGGRR